MLLVLPLGFKVKAVVESGGLVSDEIIIALIKERIIANDCTNGFLFNGFPRTVVQAEALLREGIDADYIIDIHVPDEEIIKKLTGRLMHLISGRIYHVEFNPPKVSGIDDYAGEALIQRDDDKKEIVIQRLEVYHKQTEPLSAWYKSRDYVGRAKYIQVSGLKQVEAISAEILQYLIV